MKKIDFYLKNLLVECLEELGTNFTDNETGANANNDLIKDLLRDKNIKEKFYDVIETELSQALKEKYGI